MKIAIISDLHLAPGRLNRCRVVVSEITSLLDMLEGSHDEIIVAGDLYDLSRPVFPGGWQSHRQKMRSEFGTLLERLEAYPAVFGNHDQKRALEGVPEQLWRRSKMSVLITHGHQFDHPIKRIYGLEAAANFVAGWSVRAHLSVISSALGTVPTLLEGLKGKGADASLEGAESLLKTSGADVVVLGHSHLLRAVRTPFGMFINSGSWTESNAQWVSLDLSTRVCELWERFRGEARLVERLTV